MIAPVVLAWYACDLKTGIIAEELHSLVPSGTIGRKLGTSVTANFNLDLNGAPPAWEDATQPGRTMLCAVDTATQTPLWAGLILTRDGGSSNTVQLGTATLEAYLDRRYTGTYTGVAQDQAVIITGVTTALTVDAPPFVFDAPNTGTTQDYSVQDGDDRTVLSSLQELMGQSGGAEWTIDVAWADTARTKFNFPFRVRPQIGIHSTNPEVVFDFPGCISAYDVNESYESGKGADEILAWGDGQGASRLKSAVYTATDLITAGWPRWVYRYTPATGLTDPNQLNLHASEALTQMRTGSTAWTVEAVASRSPRLGSDWAIGDSVHVHIASSPRHPNGADTVARCYAWELDPNADKVKPILLED